MLNKNLLFAALVLSSTFAFAQGVNKTETSDSKDKRMAWWREARFGMFIHWGLYAVPAGEHGSNTNFGEWIMEEAKIPIPEYEKYASQFNPVKFNASQWVKLAADAGVKYIVITTKHHDGFSMYNSAVSDYDIMDKTPFKRDPMLELANACAAQNIKLCFYHSIMDWHHPQAKAEKFSLYRDNYLKKQLTELLTNYGPIGVLWFDGEWIDEWTEDQGKELYAFVRNLQPDIIINNRVGKGRSGMQGMNMYQDAAGDFGTPEQEILETGSQLDWESCMTMNDHWGYNKNDTNFKSTESLIWNLVDCAAKGGNYLLNVGPTAEGLIPGQSIERMSEIGKWMQINSEAIYNSKPWIHFNDGENVRYTSTNKGHIYAIVKEISGNKLTLKRLVPLKNSQIQLLGSKATIAWEQTSNGTEITLPSGLTESLIKNGTEILVFKIEGKPQEISLQPVLGTPEEQKQNFRIFERKTTLEFENTPPDTKIYYTLDGSSPGIQSHLYSKPIPIDSSCQVKAICVAKNKIYSYVTTFGFRKATFGIKLLSLPSTRYSASGPLTLADGHRGSLKYNDGNWLGYEGIDFESVIDLGKTQPIDTLGVTFLQNHNSWIFLPLAVEVYTSVDNHNFKPAGITFRNIPLAYSENSIALFSIALSVEARYILVKAKNPAICPTWHNSVNGKAWIFLDEIEIK